MPISELGYRHWEGKRVPASRRWLAITRSHVGIAFRSSKLLRRFLILGWMPLLYFAPIFFTVGYLADPANPLDDGSLLANIGREIFPRGLLEILRDRPETILPAVWSVAFYLFLTVVQSFIAMLALAIVAPPLISRDVRSKAFLLYLSKPISAWEYLAGKLGVAMFFLFVITLFPALVLYLISVGLSPNLSTVAATLPILFRVIVTGFVMATPICLVALLISSLTKENRVATFGWMAVWILGEISYMVVSFGNDLEVSPWAFLLSLRETTVTASVATLGLGSYLGQMRSANSELDAAISNFGHQIDVINPALAEAFNFREVDGIATSTVALIYLGAVSVVSAVIIMRRITKPVRI